MSEKIDEIPEVTSFLKKAWTIAVSPITQVYNNTSTNPETDAKTKLLSSMMNYISLSKSTSQDQIEEQRKAEANFRNVLFEDVPAGIERRTPTVKWKQDLDNIHLVIQVNVDDFTFNCTMKTIYFEAKVGDKAVYRLMTSLFACVDPNNVKAYKSGVDIRVKLEKLTCDEKWPRLLEVSKAPTWLKVDVDPKELDKEYDSDDNFQINYEFDKTNLPGTIINSELIETPEKVESFNYSDDDFEDDDPEESREF